MEPGGWLVSRGVPPSCRLGWPFHQEPHCRGRSVGHRSASLGPELVISVLSDVTDPWQGLVAALLDDLQVAHLDARGSEVGDLELDADWGLALLVLCLHAGQAEVGSHQVFLATREGLDGPHDLTVLGDPLDASHCCLELG